MKYFSLLLLLACASFHSYAQKTEAEKYAQSILAADLEQQQQVFGLKYIFSYYAIHEIEDTLKKGTRTLQVAKNEIQDTLKPFFNTVVVNAQTLVKPKSELRTKSEVGHLFNSEFFSKDKDLKAFEGKVNYNVTGFPYKTYMQIYSNVTSVIDESGKNILVSGKDTIFDTWTSYKSGDQYFCTAKFLYDNTTYPKVLTVTGTATMKVPTKFLVTTFLPSEAGTSKPFQQYTFTLKECAAGKVIVSAGGYTSKTGIDVIPVGPSNVRYRKDQQRMMGGTIYTDEFIYNLAKDHNTVLSNDSLKAVYFDQYIAYLKKGPVKQITLYSGLYKGNIQKVYIVKPIEFITITESFTATSK